MFGKAMIILDKSNDNTGQVIQYYWTSHTHDHEHNDMGRPVKTAGYIHWLIGRLLVTPTPNYLQLCVRLQILHETHTLC